MAEATEATAKKALTFTDAEQKLLMSVMKNLKSIEFDVEAVREECGYKDTKTLSTMWGRLKKNKLGMTSTATPAKKATPGKKRKGDGDDAANGDDEEVETPTKRARKPKGGKREDSVAKDEKTRVKEEEDEL